MPRKPLTEEHFRILQAAFEGRLKTNLRFRWIIRGESVPDYRSRRQLIDYLDRITLDRLTDMGIRALTEREAA